MWLPINGEPPPNGASSGGGGGGFQVKKVNVGRSVMRARVTHADAKAEKNVQKNKKRVADDRKKQQSVVVDMRHDASDLTAMLKKTGASVDTVRKVEEKYNALVEQKLAQEKVKIRSKQRELAKLNKKLKLAQKNQAKIFCGMALWKILCVAVLLLVAGLVAQSLL